MPREAPSEGLCSEGTYRSLRSKSPASTLAAMDLIIGGYSVCVALCGRNKNSKFDELREGLAGGVRSLRSGGVPKFVCYFLESFGSDQRAAMLKDCRERLSVTTMVECEDRL